MMRLKSMAAFHASVWVGASVPALAATSGSFTAAEAQKSLARWAPSRRTAAARRVAELAADGRAARTRAPTTAAREAAGSRALMWRLMEARSWARRPRMRVPGVTGAGSQICDKAAATCRSQNPTRNCSLSSARFHTLRYAVSMHPPLTLENHPLCRDIVIALKRCHRDASWWGRSFGACNEQKWALDQCLKKQKLFKARANAEKAREERDRLRRRVEKYGHATVNGEFKGK